MKRLICSSILVIMLFCFGCPAGVMSADGGAKTGPKPKIEISYEWHPWGPNTPFSRTLRTGL